MEDFKIGKIEVATPEYAEDVLEAEKKRHAFNQKVSSVLETIKDKDSTAHFNWDKIGDSEQAIAFTDKGRIIVHNNFESIIIEQDGKEDMKFSSSEEEKALAEIENIVNNF